MTYFRAIDPLPLQSAEHNKLHEFYQHLGMGRLTTTRCDGCGRIDWPPRGFCPVCGSDRFTWVDLPHEGRVHAFTVQEVGVPAGFAGPLVFAVVKVGPLRIFAPIVGPNRTDVTAGTAVRFVPVRVADEPQGGARHLPAFELPGGKG